jgi:hypothetical protein
MALICKEGSTREDTIPTALHQLPATPQTVHWGYFDPALAPVLTVKASSRRSAPRTATRACTS